MKLSVRIFAIASVLLLSAFALHALPPGWVYEGCWSPYPNCIGARDVFHDADGNDWECGMCGTSSVNPDLNYCMQGGGLHDEERQGRWCTPEDVETTWDASAVTAEPGSGGLGAWDRPL